MSLNRDHQRIEAALALAAELLGAPARLILLDYSLERLLERRGVREVRRGLAGGLPVENLYDAPRGRSLLLGLERWRLTVDGRTLHVVRIADGLRSLGFSRAARTWVFPSADYVRIYRYLRREARREDAARAAEPLLPEPDRRRLWRNTLEFLRERNAAFARFGVARKRGLLLTGEPGNGKTMTCRWLAEQCRARRLAWREVDAEDYEDARKSGNAASLFELDRPGVVLFDDFERGMRNRKQEGTSSDHSVLLAGLDGVTQHEGVVYIFTSNLAPADLDPAFLRPGRIDLVLHFPRPDRELRRRLIAERWPAEIAGGLDVEQAVADTEGRSFAELAELKKLLVLRWAETNRWEWDWALREHQARLGPNARPRRRIGFDSAAALSPPAGEPSEAISAGPRG